MICPYCNHSFRLTWGRYLRGLTGRHVCPACRKVAGFKRTLKYYFFLGVFWAVYYAVVILLLQQFAGDGLKFVNSIYGFARVFLIGLVFILPLDKYLDEKICRLTKIT